MAAAFVGYYRVSTRHQGLSGLGLAAQRESVRAYASSKQGELMAEFEEWEGGHKGPASRPALAAAIECCRERRATLLIARLDRLARNVMVVSNLMKSGIDFLSVDVPQANRFTIHILAAVAEYERHIAGVRIREALMAYQDRGGKLGFARMSPDELAAATARGHAALVARSNAFAAKTIPIIQEMVAGGITDIAGITRALNRRGIPTMYGRGPWRYPTVMQLVARADPGSPLLRPGRYREHAQKVARANHVAFRQRADAFALALLPLVNELRADGINTWSALARGLDARGITTRRNRLHWSAWGVRTITLRAEALRAAA